MGIVRYINHGRTYQVLDGVCILRVEGHGRLPLVVPLVDPLVERPVVEH